MRALFAGSFMPPTLGHLDIIRRGAGLFDELVVAVLVNGEKTYALSPEARVGMLKKIMRDLSNVSVVSSDGLLVDLVRETGCDVILKGVRDASDMSYEMQLAEANRMLAGYETLFLPSLPEFSRLSSTIVRDCAKHRASLKNMVSEELIDEIYKIYAPCI